MSDDQQQGTAGSPGKRPLTAHPLFVPVLVVLVIAAASVAFYLTELGSAPAFESDSARSQGALSVDLPEGYCPAPPSSPAFVNVASWWGVFDQVIFVAVPCDARTEDDLILGPGLFVQVLYDHETKRPAEYDDEDDYRAWVMETFRAYLTGSDEPQHEVVEERSGFDNAVWRKFPAIETERYILLPNTLQSDATDKLPARHATYVSGFALIDGRAIHVQFKMERIDDATMARLVDDAALFMDSLDVEFNR